MRKLRDYNEWKLRNSLNNNYKSVEEKSRPLY